MNKNLYKVLQTGHKAVKSLLYNYTIKHKGVTDANTNNQNRVINQW